MNDLKLNIAFQPACYNHKLNAFSPEYTDIQNHCDGFGYPYILEKMYLFYYVNVSWSAYCAAVKWNRYYDTLITI